jgi:hypothetical protein
MQCRELLQAGMRRAAAGFLGLEFDGRVIRTFSSQKSPFWITTSALIESPSDNWASSAWLFTVYGIVIAAMNPSIASCLITTS